MAASSVAFVVSGNFTPRSRRKSFPVQLSRVTHMHLVTLSLSPVPRRRWHELNPSMQAHAGEPLLVLQTPKALQCARLVQHKS